MTTSRPTTRDFLPDDPADPAAGPALATGRRLALVVGIDKYAAGIPPLANAVRDATAIHELLTRHGYQSELFCDQDATLLRLDQLLRTDLPAKVGPADRVLFYFAGHGHAIADPQLGA